MATVADVYAMVDALAPFDTAEEWDNVGLLVGKMDRPVDTVLTALDATRAVVAEAVKLGAQLIVTHHPLLFSPVRRLDEADPEAAVLCDLVRGGVSLIAAHTNLDLAPGGVNDALAARLRWPVSGVDGVLRLGGWQRPMRLGDLRREAQEALGAPVLAYGDENRHVARFAICSGSGASEVDHAAKLGAEVYLTGEMRHDALLRALAQGMCVLAGGHYATEICAADLLARHLQSAANAVEFSLRVVESKINPFV